MSSTPLQAIRYSVPVYADPAATMSGGTPLIVAISRAGRSEEYITVKLQLLQAYDRAIFELQQELAHYKTLLSVLLPKAAPESLRLESTPLNPASVRVLNSIAQAKISQTAVHTLDDDERD